MTAPLRTEAPLIPDPPWFGELPPHWETWRLKHLVRFESGGTPSKDESEFWRGDIPWVSPKDMKAERISDTEDHITQDAVRGSATRLVPSGAVLLVVRSGILRHSIPVAVATREVALNQDLKALIPKGQVLPEYLAATIRGYTNPLLVSWRKAGATVDSLEMELVANTPFPVPPLPEQRAIANFLDRKTAEIDALLAEKQRLLELLQEKRTALITQAVNKGLDPDVETKDSGVEWLGEIPAHWDVVQLRYLVRPNTNITYGIVQAGPDIPGGVPYIRTGDMAGGALPRTGFKRTSEEIDQAYRRSKVQTGDIVVAIRASVGKALQVPKFLEGANLTQGTAKVAPGQQLQSRYLLYALQSIPSQQRFEALAKGATFQEITLDMLRRFSIPLPPLSEQTDIAGFLAKNTAQLTTVAELTTAAINHLHEYRTALISAAVTGKIDVREEAA